MEERVKQYIKEYNLIQMGDSIILGISGGADSVCLFLMFIALKKEYHLDLIVVHINHNLRGSQGDEDQAFVEQLCERYQVKCFVYSEQVKEESSRRKKSLEETGRELRKEAFQKEVMREWRGSGKERQSIKIATAHHGNDNVETFLMNLMRGTGITGLSGMKPKNGEYIKPLLCMKRKEIEAYLEENHTSFCVDESNYDTVYIRNKIRNQIIPMMEEGVNIQTTAHIEAVMKELGQIDQYLQMEVHRSLETCVIEKSNPEGMLLLVEEWNQLPLILQDRLIRIVLEQSSQRQQDWRRVHIEQVRKLLQGQVGKEVHLPYEIIAQRVYQGIWFGKKQPEENQSESVTPVQKEADPEHLQGVMQCKVWDLVEFLDEKGIKDYKQIQDSHYTKYFDYDIIKEVPLCRMRESGDKIIINKEGNKQSLKKYYINNKIPAEQRHSIRIAVVNHEVLWILGYRKSEGYGVTGETKRILEIQYSGGKYGRDN